MTLSLAELMGSREAPITEAEVARFRAAGYWGGRTIRSVLADAAAAHPDREALVGYRSDGTTQRLSYREFDQAASRAAAALAHVGVRAGDAVAVMMPNWIEYGALIFGINELGAIYTGIPVSYGELQAAAILSASKAKMLVIPRRWRSGEHLELARQLRALLPSLERVVVVAEDGDGLGAGESLWSSLADAPARDFGTGEPTAICYLGFTSGTTGAPKGAMHTHETLLYSAFQLAEHIGTATFGDPMIHLVASPTGHHTGFIWGVVFTVCVGGTGVHIDRWDPVWGVDIIRREKVTTFFGAPTFLQDMMRTDLAGDPECPLRCVVIAGSPVPRNLPAQASQALGAYIAPAWGMTECSIVISCTPSAPDAIVRTDGSVLEGSNVKVADSADAEVLTGATGELLIRGPALFLGYFERPDATREAFGADGWFRTGDTASIDERGWVSLRGRVKDIIIRGGENIPVTEVETVLFDHPGIVNAAVVGVPDERLGERACAVVVTAPGVTLTLKQICEFLISQGLSKHYLPEELIVLDELPMTQSGKIQKFRLRELASAADS
jgi:cyclohexanecarboxylate-CoA ligase